MPRQILRALCFLLAAGSAGAEVLGVRGTSTQIEFYGAETNTPLVNPTPAPCCGIGVGASARDAATNRHWLGTFSVATGTRLHVINADGTATPLAFDSSERIEALAFDSQHQEMLVLARRSDVDGLRVHRHDAASGLLVASNDVSGTCCVLRAGVSTWSNTLRAFIVVGQSAVDQPPALLAIRHDGVVSAHVSGLAARTTALAVHPAHQTLYGLHTPDDAAPATGLYQIALDPAVATYSAIGVPEPGCCFVLAGPSAISGNTLQVHARAFASIDAALHQFDLGTGAVTVMPTSPTAAALHDDTSVPVSLALFRDGFE